jgi:hypothetical protein
MERPTLTLLDVPSPGLRQSVHALFENAREWCDSIYSIVVIQLLPFSAKGKSEDS